jgi:hypothetical protein
MRVAEEHERPRGIGSSAVVGRPRVRPGVSARPLPGRVSRAEECVRIADHCAPVAGARESGRSVADDPGIVTYRARTPATGYGLSQTWRGWLRRGLGWLCIGREKSPIGSGYSRTGSRNDPPAGDHQPAFTGDPCTSSNGRGRVRTSAHRRRMASSRSGAISDHLAPRPCGFWKSPTVSGRAPPDAGQARTARRWSHSGGACYRPRICGSHTGCGRKRSRRVCTR